jgi:hypothetical protein
MYENGRSAAIQASASMAIAITAKRLRAEVSFSLNEDNRHRLRSIT